MLLPLRSCRDKPPVELADGDGGALARLTDRVRLLFGRPMPTPTLQVLVPALVDKPPVDCADGEAGTPRTGVLEGVRLLDLPLVPAPRLGVILVLLEERPLVGVERGVPAPLLTDRPLLLVDTGVDGPRVLDVDRPLRRGVVSPTLLEDRPLVEDGVDGVAFEWRRVALFRPTPLPTLLSSC